MSDQQVVLCIIKLCLGGFTAFFAILLWSKTRDIAWMSIVAGAITTYVGIVFDLLVMLGIIVPGGILLWGVPVAVLVFTIIPSLFYILGFIVMLTRNR
ncbi:MAG: hypothetical protein K6E51_01285 [Treponema sp.]|nr:hypothetical protein [Treponema sp.]